MNESIPCPFFFANVSRMFDLGTSGTRDDNGPQLSILHGKFLY
jgi:hypothetical protein